MVAIYEGDEDGASGYRYVGTAPAKKEPLARICLILCLEISSASLTVVVADIFLVPRGMHC